MNDHNPPDRKTVKFQLTLPVELNTRIADWRRQQPSLPNRNEAIRLLVEHALDQAGADRSQRQP